MQIGNENLKTLSSESRIVQNIVIEEENIGKEKLHFDWIYGCSFNPNNFNLFRTKDNLLVYTVSITVVIYDRLNETQRFYREHTNVVQCFDLWKDVVVSAQKGGKSRKAQALIRLRNLKTLETLKVLIQSIQICHLPKLNDFSHCSI